MVQLKEKQIKLKATQDEISIPYGSIKRAVKQKEFLIINLFQFLMVQLKACFIVRLLRRFRISIPYGSIKRLAFCKFFAGFFHFNSLWFN